jgi:glycine/D-amino acid oxidase-like deaminating enzyme
MDLKSGHIFWPQIDETLNRTFSALHHDVDCDVAIVGGGISGALAAYYMTRAGINTVLVDRRRIAHGSTAASTGLLQYEIDTSLIELRKKIGRARAIAAYQASLHALLEFEPLVAELGDSCGLTPRPSIYIASDQKDVKNLYTESLARRSIDIKVQFLDQEQLQSEFNLPGHAALVSEQAFEIDPLRLTLRLIDRAAKAGLQVFDETEIASLESRSHAAVLCTTGGFHLTARKVILATGYEAVVQLPQGLSNLKSTYALASQPIVDFSPWPGRCMIWESARPYLYARTTEDNRAIVGGGDEDIINPHRRDALLNSKTKYLLERFEKLFPQIQIEPEFAWAGTFAETPDGLPYIGSLPQFPHCYFALGYGGNGITFSLLAAEILRDLFLGRKNDLAKLFDFSR